MKVLFLFTDMIRPNLLRVYNNEVKEGPFDKTINSIGGKLYSNCFTPAPDTPRSLACFHSGMYPEDNGCDTRIKWPYFYFKSETSMFTDLLRMGYRISYYATSHKMQNGPVPKNVVGSLEVFNDIVQFKRHISETVDNKENHVYFTTLDDYHWTNDDYGHNSLGDYLGQKKLNNFISNFFSHINKDSFDLIISFSDHGHKLNKEIREEPKLNFSNHDRSQIHLLWREKGCNDLTIDNSLRSIMDIYPSLIEFLGGEIATSITGKSLSSHGHDYLIIEDHASIKVSLDQIIDLWSVRTLEYMYTMGAEGYRLIKTSLNDEDEKDIVQVCHKRLTNYSSRFVDYQRQMEIMELYTLMKSEHGLHSDGSKRLVYHRLLPFRIIKRMLRDFYKRW